MLSLSIPSDLLTVDAAGLNFNRVPTLEEWQKTHEFLLLTRRTSLRWIADSRKVGRENFGEETVNQTEEQLMLELVDDKAASALEKLPQRIASLSDQHLLVLANRTEGETFEKWAALAEQHGLTPKELDRSIRAGEILKGKPEPINAQDKSISIVTIEGISTSFGMWLRKVSECGFPGNWDASRLRRVRDLLRPMASIAAQVDERLAELEARQE